MANSLTKNGEESNWETTTNRFVLFFDILGFKDMVQAHDHQYTLDKLNLLKDKIDEINGKEFGDDEIKIAADQTRSATFSDSIIFFSKSNGVEDLLKILYNAYSILHNAIENGIPIKGSISCGQVTVDFNKSIFFGKPIIDAYLLHENLQMLTVVTDHHFEQQLMQHDKFFPSFLSTYKVNLKIGRATHKIIRPIPKHLLKTIEELKKHYLQVSGYPRIYIDNTLDFYESLRS